MEVFKQIAAVVFAVLFLGIFAGIYSSYRSSSAKADFERNAEELADQIRLLALQGRGNFCQFPIDIPENCSLAFVGENVVATIGNNVKNYPTTIAVVGPTFTNQKITLKLERTENEVVASG